VPSFKAGLSNPKTTTITNFFRKYDFCDFCQISTPKLQNLKLGKILGIWNFFHPNWSRDG
jgi:hypothetical protein